MNHLCKTVGLIAFVALLTAGPAFTETPSHENIAEPNAAPVPVAHIYTQNLKGVLVYEATAAGRLTLVKGSPFPVIGQMEDINGKYLISVGTYYLHVYPIRPDGGVGKQVSVINTEDYRSTACGIVTTGAAGSILDHTGHFLYVQINGFNSAGAQCSTWQTYTIASNGELAFLGDADSSEFYLPIVTVSGNDNFAYGLTFGSAYGLSSFARGANGVLAENGGFAEIDPTTYPGGSGDSYYKTAVAADPSNHLAVKVYEPLELYRRPQLASYTIDNTTGSIESTNTWDDMPAPSVNVDDLEMSPSGKFLAAAGIGLQIFHFNGAAPITAFTSVLIPDAAINGMAWDKNNHLYAIDFYKAALHVFTATPTNVSEAPGSPYTIPSYWSDSVTHMIVVPKA